MKKNGKVRTVRSVRLSSRFSKNSRIFRIHRAMPQKPLVNWPFFFDHLNENKLNNSAFTKKGNGGPDLAVLFHIGKKPTSHH